VLKALVHWVGEYEMIMQKRTWCKRIMLLGKGRFNAVAVP
jgi:hypothetical protein